jgi:hypothetical protein
MPAFYLKCQKCGSEKRRILAKYADSPCDCGGVYERTDKTNPSTMIKETLDNGAMVRKIERLHNIEELVKERSSQDPNKDPGIV